MTGSISPSTISPGRSMMSGSRLLIFFTMCRMWPAPFVEPRCISLATANVRVLVRGFFLLILTVYRRIFGFLALI